MNPEICFLTFINHNHMHLMAVALHLPYRHENDVNLSSNSWQGENFKFPQNIRLLLLASELSNTTTDPSVCSGSQKQVQHFVPPHVSLINILCPVSLCGHLLPKSVILWKVNRLHVELWGTADPSAGDSLGRIIYRCEEEIQGDDEEQMLTERKKSRGKDENEEEN